MNESRLTELLIWLDLSDMQREKRNTQNIEKPPPVMIEIEKGASVMREEKEVNSWQKTIFSSHT